jgi:hypothetical protein
MDVKFRQYVDKTVDGFTFSGSYPQVHFNVFCVLFSDPSIPIEVNIIDLGSLWLSLNNNPAPLNNVYKSPSRRRRYIPKT